MRKEIGKNFEGKDYSCELTSTDNQTINLGINENGLLKFNGTITLKDIYQQIAAFDEYTMEEVFAVLKDLPDDKFAIIKESDKYKFDIICKVIKKEKHLFINLNPVIESKNDLIQRLININKINEGRINTLQKEINELKNLINNLHSKKNEAFKKEENIPKKDNAIKNEETKKNHEIKTKQTNQAPTFKPISTNLAVVPPPPPIPPPIVAVPVNVDIAKLNLEFDVGRLKFEKEFDCVNYRDNSILILSYGSIISVGTQKTLEHDYGYLPWKKETGLYIYGSYNDYQKVSYCIKYYGPLQVQYKDSTILTSKNYSFSIIKLDDTSYDILETVEYKKLFDCPILYMEILSDQILAFAFKKEICLYTRKSKGKYITENLKGTGNCLFILKLEGNEMMYLTGGDYSSDKNLTFFDYKNIKAIKTINLKVDTEYSIPITKIGNKLIAVAEISKIHLIDVTKHEITKSFDVYVRSNLTKTIRSLCPVYKNKFLLVCSYDEKNRTNNLLEYSLEEDCKYVSDKFDIKSDEFFKTMIELYWDQILILTFAGTFKILSAKKKYI